MYDKFNDIYPLVCNLNTTCADFKDINLENLDELFDKIIKEVENGQKRI